MSGIIYGSETGEGLGRFEIDLADGTHRFMMVNVTEEGIIMDVYGRAPQEFSSDTLLGTVGMTFDEWADAIVNVLDGVVAGK